MITHFRGDAAFLSNFYEYPLWYRGYRWRCAEAAYQAEKEAVDPWDTTAALFSQYDGPTAKRAGRALTCRADWPTVRLSVMQAVLAAKFAEPPLAAQLLATGDTHLEEGNTWHDTYWGTVNGFGHNHLGRLLMALRRDLRRVDAGVSG